MSVRIGRVDSRRNGFAEPVLKVDKMLARGREERRAIDEGNTIPGPCKPPESREHVARFEELHVRS